MPITQDRMLALLHAAQDYRHALTTIIETIKQHERAVEFGRETMEVAMQVIFAQSNPAVLLTEPEATVATLTIEAKHFKDNAKRNTREKLRQRGIRHMPQHVQGHTAPISVMPPSMISRPNLVEALELGIPLERSAAEDRELERLAERNEAKLAALQEVTLPTPNVISEKYQVELAEESADLALGLFGEEPEPEAPIDPGEYSKGKVGGRTI